MSLILLMSYQGLLLLVWSGSLRVAGPDMIIMSSSPIVIIMSSPPVCTVYNVYISFVRVGGSPCLYIRKHERAGGPMGGSLLGMGEHVSIHEVPIQRSLESPPLGSPDGFPGRSVCPQVRFPVSQ